MESLTVYGAEGRNREEMVESVEGMRRDLGDHSCSTTQSRDPWSSGRRC